MAVANYFLSEQIIKTDIHYFQPELASTYEKQEDLLKLINLNSKRHVNSKQTALQKQESKIKWALESHLEITYLRKIKCILMIEKRCNSLNGDIYLLMAEKT